MNYQHPPIVCGVCLLCACIFWIDYRIIESIGRLSFCKKRDFYDGDSENKWGMLFFCGGCKRKKK